MNTKCNTESRATMNCYLSLESRMAGSSSHKQKQNSLASLHDTLPFAISPQSTPTVFDASSQQPSIMDRCLLETGRSHNSVAIDSSIVESMGHRPTCTHHSHSMYHDSQLL
ncbi:Uncharacterized protein HZ326_21079 [Fusarium oxysporum f. sp. albedinis]|nr:Uncharacterized protein HZ326_21079 [Fusarium oxysporum f. sp. albedinis]